MFKRILVISTLVALTGCATHQQANTAVGAGMGAVVGKAVGGDAGAAFGAILGAAVGSNQPTQQPAPVVVHEVVREQPRVIYADPVRPSSVYPDYSVCSQWHYQARQSCYRGAEARARQEQNRINREAYQRGYQGR